MSESYWCTEKHAENGYQVFAPVHRHPGVRKPKLDAENEVPVLTSPQNKPTRPDVSAVFGYTMQGKPVKLNDKGQIVMAAAQEWERNLPWWVKLKIWLRSWSFKEDATWKSED